MRASSRVMFTTANWHKFSGANFKGEGPSASFQHEVNVASAALVNVSELFSSLKDFILDVFALLGF